MKKQTMISITLSLALCITMTNSIFNISNTHASKAIDFNPEQQYVQSFTNMESKLKKSMEELNIPATNIIVLENNQTIYEKSFGIKDKINNLELTKDTLFNMGSISKIYVTASILKLHQDNKLSIDDPIINYIPEFKMVDPRYKDITIRMLLNHSSGLPGADFYNAFLINKDISPNHTKNNIDDLQNQYLKSNPGEYSVYCNEGFNIAQFIVERVSEKEYEEFLNETFFKPMNLSNTYLSSNSKLKDENFPRLYDANNNLLPREIMTHGFAGTGGLSATAKDIAIFGNNILSPNSKIFNDETINLFRENQGLKTKLGNSAFFNGLGWDNIVPRFNSTPVYAKSGGTMQYQTQLLLAPDKNITIVGLSTLPSEINPIVEDLMFDILNEQSNINTDSNYVNIPKKSTMDNSFKLYEGIYSLGMVPIMTTVKFENNNLILSLNFDNSQSHTYVYREDKAFWSEEISPGKYECITFETIDNKIFLIKNSIENNNKYSQILAQKLDDNMDNKSWSKLSGTTWLQTNFSKNNIYSVFAISKLENIPGLKGFTSFNGTPYKIFDDSTALAGFETLTNTGTLIVDKDTIKLRQFEFINSNSIPAFDIQALNTIEFYKDNQSYWYKVNTPFSLNLEEYNDTIRLCIYNLDGILLYDNIGNKQNINIPENSYLMISGNKNTKLNLRIK